MRVHYLKRRHLGNFIFAGFAAFFFLCLSAKPGLTQEDEIAAGGRFLYQTHCAVCHGVDGDGNGRMASELLIKPADLTQLAKKNGGLFPFWPTYGVIDGREEVASHGSRAMPVWGAWFQMEEGHELRATGRILELLYYLKSIQQK